MIKTKKKYQELIKGKQAFRTIWSLSSYVIMFSGIFIAFTGMGEVLWTFGLILVLFTLTLLLVQEYARRIHSEKRAGQEILDADVDLDHARTEEKLLPIEKIESFVDVPITLQNAVNDFVKQMGKIQGLLKKGEVDKYIEELDGLLEQKLLETKKDRETKDQSEELKSFELKKPMELIPLTSGHEIEIPGNNNGKKRKFFKKANEIDFSINPTISRLAKFVDECAIEGVKEFKHNEIIEALKSNGENGIEIYAWLEARYPQHWQLLLKEGVLERMAFYSNKYFTPEWVRILSEIDISKYVKSPTTFSEDIIFDAYEERPFRRAVFYAPKPLREFIKWDNQYKLYIDGYRTNVVLGKVSLMLLGWALPDYPQFLVAYTPSQNQAIFEAQITAEQLNYDTKDLLKKIVFFYRRENDVNKMKVIEAKIDRDRFEKRWNKAMDKFEYEKYDDPQEPEKKPKVIYQTNPTIYITLGLLSILTIIFAILAFI